MRKGRFLYCVASTVALVAAFVVSPLPAGADSSRFESIDGGTFQDKAAADANAPVTVVLKLGAEPVAKVQSKAPNKTLAADRKAQITNDLQGAQEGLKPAIAANGGKVLAQYQSAYNGIKVRVPRGNLPALAALPGVVSVSAVPTYSLDLTQSVPFIGTPQIWQDAGVHGEGVRVAIIDTGIDYTHANFAGPGSPSDYTTEHQRILNGEQPNPAWFGPAAPKIKGGIDFVGDDYDASTPGHDIPNPSTSPLDCNGHGSHVAGITGGLGVTSDGSTYTGPYDSTTYSNDFKVGPGVAPKVDLYAVRVFGCNGSTNVVVDALDWSVAHNMQVINMSLGSSYGSEDSASAQAAQNAADAGILVVASAGNSGNFPYINGSPAVAPGAISVAAIDSHPTFQGAHLALSTGQSLDALIANDGAFTDGTTLPVIVLRNPDNSVSLGCDEAEYQDALITGKLVVTLRGSCARVDRATFGARHGAAAVAMVNTDPNYPPFEGHIPNVTIPFLGIRGVLGAGSDGAKIVAADGGTGTLTNIVLTNPGFRGFASFTSKGPKLDERALKPDISAPGVSINSTGVGSGNDVATISGTSQAAPHVAGVAALAFQQHGGQDGWWWDRIRASIINTADPGQLTGFNIGRGGTGLVQPVGAVKTNASVEDSGGAANLSFGFRELMTDFSGTHSFTVSNQGSSPITFNIASAAAGGSPHSTSLTVTSLSVPAHSSRNDTLRLNVPAATAGNSAAFREVSGFVTLTPADPSMNNGVTLRIPYYLVPKARSNVNTNILGAFDPSHPNATARLTNPNGPIPGDGDFYTWGLYGENWGADEMGVRAVGAQQAVDGGGNPLVVFALNVWNLWSTPNRDVFQIFLDVGMTGHDNYEVRAEDQGVLTGTGAFNGVMVVGVINLSTGSGVIRYLATAPFDGATIELPFRKSDVGLTPANPRFSYHVKTHSIFAGDGRPGDEIVTPAPFNAFTSATNNGQDALVNPNATVDVPISINVAEWAITPARGLMIVTLDNRIADVQARLVDVGSGGGGGGGSAPGRAGSATPPTKPIPLPPGNSG